MFAFNVLIFKNRIMSTLQVLVTAKDHAPTPKICNTVKLVCNLFFKKSVAS